MESRFDEVVLARELSKLAFHQQLAFGVACCERMLPNYEAFSQEAGWFDATPLRQALDHAWRVCEGLEVPKDGLQQMLTRCDGRLPQEEDFPSLYVSAAFDAVASTCHLIDFVIDGEVEHLVFVGRFATETVDLVVQELEHMDPQDPQLERKILEHFLMQLELSRQRRDLRDAMEIPPHGGDQLASFRERSQGEVSLRLDN